MTEPERPHVTVSEPLELQVARELVQSGDYIVGHYVNDIIFAQYTDGSFLDIHRLGRKRRLFTTQEYATYIGFLSLKDRNRWSIGVVGREFVEGLKYVLGKIAQSHGASLNIHLNGEYPNNSRDFHKSMVR